MRLTPWQSWQGIFTHIVSPHVRRVHLAKPQVGGLPPERSGMSRRTFMRGTAGVASLAFALERGVPAQAAKPSPAEPFPIPHIQVGPPLPNIDPPLNVPAHFFFPGPVDSTEAERGHEPSVVTDFTGVIGVAELNLTGTGTDATTGQSDRYGFTVDIRFMQGDYIGADGRQRPGTFLFV